jgi:hypothetical protein
MLYEVAYYSDFICINVYSSYQRHDYRENMLWLSHKNNYLRNLRYRIISSHFLSEYFQLGTTV